MDANKSQWGKTSCEVYIPQNNENAKILVPQEKLCSLAAAAATMAPTQLLLFLKQEGGSYMGWFVHNGIELTTEPWIKLLQIHLSPFERNWVLTSRTFAASGSNKCLAPPNDCHWSFQSVPQARRQQGWCVHNATEMTTEAKKLLLLQGSLPPFKRNWVLKSKTFAAEAATMTPALIAVPLFSLFLEQGGGVNMDVSTLGVNSHQCSNMQTHKD